MEFGIIHTLGNGITNYDPRINIFKFINILMATIISLRPSYRNIVTISTTCKMLF